MTEAEKLEKLINIGNAAFIAFCYDHQCTGCPYADCDPCTIRFLADYLADHGVTVKEDGQP